MMAVLILMHRVTDPYAVAVGQACFQART